MLQVASYIRNRDKIWPDEPLGSYEDLLNAVCQGPYHARGLIYYLRHYFED